MPKKELVFDASQLSVTVTCEKCGVSVTIGPLTAGKTPPAGIRSACSHEQTVDGIWLRQFGEFVKAAGEKNLRLRVPLD
jgi:hypothetical protein